MTTAPTASKTEDGKPVSSLTDHISGGYKVIEILGVFLTVAGSDLLRPLGAYTLWLLIIFSIGVGLSFGFRWRPLARIKALCIAGTVVSLALFAAQIVKAPKFGPNPGVIADTLPAIKFAQAAVLPLNPTDRLMLRLEAKLKGTEQEAIDAARTALAASGPDTWHYVAEAIFASPYPSVQRIAFFEVLRRRSGANLLIETDSTSQTTLASPLSDARLQLCCSDSERGTFGGSIRNDSGERGIRGSVSNDGITIEADLPNHSGQPFPLLLKLHPNQNSRLVGSATANGESCGISISLL